MASLVGGLKLGWRLEGGRRCVAVDGRVICLDQEPTLDAFQWLLPRSGSSNLWRVLVTCGESPLSPLSLRLGDVTFLLRRRGSVFATVFFPISNRPLALVSLLHVHNSPPLACQPVGHRLFSARSRAGLRPVIINPPGAGYRRDSPEAAAQAPLSAVRSRYSTTARASFPLL